MKCLERSGRSLSEGIVPVFECTDWGKQRKPSVMIQGDSPSVEFYVMLTVHLELFWMIINTMHCFSSVYWVITPLRVPGVSAAHHQEVEYIYIYIYVCVCVWQMVLVILLSWLSSGLVRLCDSQIRSITSTTCHIRVYTFYRLTMGCRCARNM
jgi:hypothetical protein